MRVTWSDAALEELTAIIEYIELFDQPAAYRLAGRMVACAQSLEQFPHRGTPLGDGRRQMSIVYPYLIRYRVLDDHVEIDSIRHGARAG
ncbi:type II toxin-antitoxin system RelE/ParE family toxin [Sphingomonas sp. LB-2]|uniref:type II toxin-antitoxin system RelE/ParE family toxin n=1 Tax=Sphingomonas caeni TaxID=2984949 RepID=UPI0022305961|nr:type II toxin-antitoxin system RelE/ParE family toxin [Sphingomonas caeni]MCW3845892.1 type II toxin-antitoxin system RelE/ParE family toxin [Sphingomonas caeni]